MPTAWGGGDPVPVVDPDDYEIGTQYRANADITITHIRVHTGAGEINIANRKGRVWSTGGAQLAIADMPDNLPDGWSQHALTTPLAVTAGTNFIVSFMTGGNESALAGALAGNVNSADGLVTAVAAGSAVFGNGVFNLTPTVFPNTGNPGQSFLGVDFVYTVGISGNTAPQITSITAAATGALVTATVAATDAETLVGATYRYTWGDGSADTVTGFNVASHTYPASGSYALQVTVTDADGLSDTASIVIDVVILSGYELRLYDVASILVSGIDNDLAGTIAGRPNRACVVPGAIAWDQCDCGLLAVSHNRWFLSDNFPLETGPGTKTTPCELGVLVVEMSIQIIRCVPSPTGTSLSVPCSKLNTASQVLVQDAYVTLKAARRILCELKDDGTILDYTFNEQTALGPEGGCAGTDLRALVAIDLR